MFARKSLAASLAACLALLPLDPAIGGVVKARVPPARLAPEALSAASLNPAPPVAVHLDVFRSGHPQAGLTNLWNDYAAAPDANPAMGELLSLLVYADAAVSRSENRSVVQSAAHTVKRQADRSAAFKALLAEIREKIPALDSRRRDDLHAELEAFYTAAAARAEPAVAPGMPQAFMAFKLLLQALQSRDETVRREALNNFPALIATLGPAYADDIFEFYRLGMLEPQFRLADERNLEAMARVLGPAYARKILDLAEAGMEHDIPGVRASIARSLGGLASALGTRHRGAILNLTQMGLGDKNYDVVAETASSFGPAYRALGKAYADRILAIVRWGLRNRDKEVRLSAASILKLLPESFGPRYAVQITALYERAAADKDSTVAHWGIESLPGLIKIVKPAQVESLIALVRRRLRSTSVLHSYHFASILEPLARTLGSESAETILDLVRAALDSRRGVPTLDLERLGTVAKVVGPDHADEIITIVKKYIDPKTHLERLPNVNAAREATNSLSALIRASGPNFADKLLPLLEMGLGNKQKYFVRDAIIPSLAATAQVWGPDYAEPILALLERGLRDGNDQVSLSAAKSLGGVAQGLGPRAGQKILKLLRRCLNNKKTHHVYKMREAASENLGLIFSSLGPDFENSILRIYKKLLTNEGRSVRRNAAFSLGGIAQALGPKRGRKILNLYKKGVRHKDSDVLDGTSRALSVIAKALGPSFAAEILELARAGLPHTPGTAETLGALGAALEPEHRDLLHQLFEFGLKMEKGVTNHYVAKNIATVLEFVDLAPLKPFLNEIADTIPLSEQMYVWQTVALLARDGPRFWTQLKEESLPAWEKLKQSLTVINASFSEHPERQVKDPLALLREHQGAIAVLHAVDPKKTNQYILELARSLGLPRLKYWLRFVDRLGSDALTVAQARLWIEQFRPSPRDFGQFILQLSFFQTIRSAAALSRMIAKGPRRNPAFLEYMNRQLLSAFLLNWEVDVQRSTADSLAGWEMEYLPQLAQAYHQYESDDRELLGLILKMAFSEKNFLAALSEPLTGSYDESERAWIEQIQKHNNETIALFKQFGLDYTVWSSWSKILPFKVGTSHETRRKRKEDYLDRVLEEIQTLFGNRAERKPGLLKPEDARRLYGAVLEKWGLQTERKARLSQILEDKKIGAFFDDLSKEIQKIIDAGGDPTGALATSLSHLLSRKKEAPGLSAELNSSSYSLSIRLWKRLPGHDLFQGHYSACCIALDHANKAAMLDYLLDVGFNIVEVVDETTGKTMAQTFVFPVRDAKNGKISLVADSVEIHPQYRGFREEIEKNLGLYLNEYADAVGKGSIQGVLERTSDEGAPKLELTKLGGFIRDRMYLDAAVGWIKENAINGTFDSL